MKTATTFAVETQDLHHPLLVSIGSVIAASPSRRCHSRSGLASMAARVGLGNQPPWGWQRLWACDCDYGYYRHY
jgi:hypothetical protein